VLTDAIKREHIPEIVKLLMRDIYKHFNEGGLRKKNLRAFLESHDQKKGGKKAGPGIKP
jgi:hypothetical protein